MGSVRGHSRQGGGSGGTAPSPSKQLMPQRSNRPNTVFQRRGLKILSALGSPVLPLCILREFAVGSSIQSGSGGESCSWSWVSCWPVTSS